jgi:ParB family transcriptional regulator, chromosome partitioning protein
MRLLYLHPNQIEHDPSGIREDMGDLAGLAQTIRDRGMLQPLGVVPLQRDQYRVVYGGRRLGAARELGLDRVPCIVLDADDPDLLLQQLIENVQRRDLNDMEKARAFHRLRDHISAQDSTLNEGALDERTGQEVGIAPRTVRRYLGLLDLPDEVQQMIRDEELSVTQAQHLRRIALPRAQIELARMAADEGLSAADISNLANYFAANPNLSLETALQALQNGTQLRTRATPEPSASVATPQATTRTAEDADDDLWDAEADDGAEDDPAFSAAHAEESPSRTKARVFRLRSLDQMVDETDRLARAYHEGDLEKWVRGDDTAAFKLRLLLKQLRALSQAIETLAQQNNLPIADEE